MTTAVAIVVHLADRPIVQVRRKPVFRAGSVGFSSNARLQECDIVNSKTQRLDPESADKVSPDQYSNLYSNTDIVILLAALTVTFIENKFLL